jgi:uncharacterized protein (DUF433 family)
MVARAANATTDAGPTTCGLTERRFGGLFVRRRQCALALVFSDFRTADSRAASRREGLGSNGDAPMRFTRITVDAKQMSGVPCIRGLRIPVATIIGMVADGMTATDILAAYPDLEREDIQEALHYAADAVRERELPLTVP